METMLIVVTVVSLGVALVTSVMAWRAAQKQTRLSAARVAALAAAAATPDAPAPSQATAPQDTPGSPWRTPVHDGGHAELASFASEGRRAAPATPAVAPAIPAADTVAVHAGFLGSEPAVRGDSSHQRWLASAAAILAIVLGSIVYARMSGPTQATTAQAQAAESPLELLSLRHEREGVNLAVAGLVRNPPTGAMIERVTAMVYLFDAQGTFVTSARAPIDFLKLTAGDESPFVVKVAAPQTVARYRVSFRTEDGTLPHVDRRGDQSVAAPVALSRP